MAAAYERGAGAHSRLLQAAKLYLFGASSGLFNCPLAMTDGAARLCEVTLAGLQGGAGDAGEGGGSSSGGGEQQRRQLAEALGAALRHLTSRDPARFWTSGQASELLQCCL